MAKIFFIRFLNRFSFGALVSKNNLKKPNMFLTQPIRTVRQNLKFLLSILTIGFFLTNCKSTEREEEEDGMQQAMHQEFLMTRDPALNVVPKERLLTAMDYMNNARLLQPAALTWQERG